jgi:CubicO group peptidase (beta-lactamase class C family)
MNPGADTPVPAGIDEADLSARVGEVLHDWPVAGLAVGVIRGGSLAWFHAHGLASIEAGTPVGADTVFRIASVTKTMTAIAVMQLWEQGLVDLDAPASEYLRAYRLVPARESFRPATLRHLLTHTAGIRAARTAADLMRPVMGWGVPAGRPVPPLAGYYAGGLRIDVEPGTKWAYCNHGFATLGQIVEDVSGLPFGTYLRERVFSPLGMDSSDLARSQRIRSRLATGYQLRARGLVPVTDRENVPAGAGSVYSTTTDMARYVAALLSGGTNEHGTVLRPGTLAELFRPHYQPDPRIPGMGLGFFRGQAGGHEIVGHEGIWTGFHTAMLLAPGQGIGVVVFTNTGPFSPLAAALPVANAVLRGILRLGDDAAPAPVPQQPWIWRDLCGWYSFGPGVLTDPQPRMLGPAVGVVVRHGQLVLRGQFPVPAVRRGFVLQPDGAGPDTFRIGIPGLGSATSAAVFSRGPGGEVTALHLAAQPLSLHKRTAVRRTRPGPGRARPGSPHASDPPASAAGPAGSPGSAPARRRA